MFLWDLNISEIPIGWQKEFDIAKLETPNGEYVTYQVNNDESDTYYYNIPASKEFLENTFNEQKAKAQELYSESMDSQTISKLIECDILLYNVLCYWVMDEDIEFSDFNPDFITKSIYDTNCYLTSSYWGSMRKYDGLRFFHLSSEFLRE